MSEFKELKLTDLIASESNPRSEFNEDSLNELAQSIKEHGVLQPIIVRVHPDNSKKFEIVCGERRYRASKIAALKTIPASIRELNDDEVFEIQIVENLERKDVHPMDEAVAFKRMLESGKYTMEDIAAKVAKNTTFVAQRLKLNDLIPDLQRDFKDGLFGVGHAVLLARVDVEQQTEILEQYEGEEYPTISELEYDLTDLSLEYVKFDIEDATLVPEAGPCSTCPKSSFGNPVLFPEYEQKVCFDKTCYTLKKQTSDVNELQKMIYENPGLIFIRGWYDPVDHVAKVLDDNGKKSIMSSDYNVVENGIKAFSLNNWKFMEIELIGQGKEKVSDSPTINLEVELSEIKKKAARNLELDREKIMTRINEEIIKNEDRNLITDNPMLLDETPAFLVALYEKGSWEFRKWMDERFGLTRLYSDNGSNYQKFKDIPSVVNDEMEIYRAFTVLTLQSDYTLDFEKNTTTKALYDYVKVSYPKEIELFTLEQNDIASKRIQKSDARIKVLEDEIAGLTSAVKRCKSCKKSDDDFQEEFDNPMMWKGDYCLSCSLKLEKA